MRIFSLLAAGSAIAGLVACTERVPMASDTEPGSGSAIAVARLSPTEGNQVTGTVRFMQMDDGVHVVADIQGLTPGEHGFHVHETGDCSAPDATSAGGHFNPTDQPHAGRDAAQRHVGDLGNLTANAEGIARADFLDAHLALSGPNSIVGKAVIVHAGRDDQRSQPAGDAGARVACGVVELEQ